jgi:hypothetical protein
VRARTAAAAAGIGIEDPAADVGLRAQERRRGGIEQRRDRSEFPRNVRLRRKDQNGRRARADRFAQALPHVSELRRGHRTGDRPADSDQRGLDEVRIEGTDLADQVGGELLGTVSNALRYRFRGNRDVRRDEAPSEPAGSVLELGDLNREIRLVRRVDR